MQRIIGDHQNIYPLIMWQPFPLIKSLTPCNVSYFPVDCLLHSSSLVVIFVHQFFFLRNVSDKIMTRVTSEGIFKNQEQKCYPFWKIRWFSFLFDQSYSLNPPPHLLPLSPHPHFPRLFCSFWTRKGLGEEFFLDALLKMHRCLHRCGITRVFIATLCLKSSEIFGEMGSFSK